MRRYDFVMHRETMRRRQHMENRKTKLALVWIVVTSAVGFMYILNDIASREGGGLLLSGFIQTPATNMLGFEPGVLWLLFTEDYFTRPPIPVILAVALALVGMAFLDKDQSIITYLSFAQLPLLIAMGVVTTEPGLTIAVWRTWTNVPSRWIAMSITMVNLFWLVAPYALAKHIYRWGVLRCEKAAYGIS